MTLTPAATQLRAGSWTVVPARTRATFATRNLGHLAHGSIAVSSGALVVDQSGAPSSVRAELDLTSIDTGVPRRDADLHKRRLLDIDNHPTMTFTADVLVETSDGWRADGVLSLRGTSCPLVVTGTYDAEGAGGDLHVVATATLDRTAIGIRVPTFIIGRLIEISIDAWLAGPHWSAS